MTLIAAGEKLLVARHAAQTLIAVKSADESVTSSTTLQDDDHLFVSVDANTVYLFEFQFTYNAPVAAGGFKQNWTVPSGMSGVVSGLEQATGNGFAINFPLQNNWAANANDRVGFLYGRVSTSSTAGTLRLQWAQNTSNGASVVLRKGSFIRLMVIG